MTVTHIIFDFNGVILESVTANTEAFRSLFSFVPEHVEEIVQFHVDNGGMSRFDKFRHIYYTLLHEDLSKDTFEKLPRRFSDLIAGWKTAEYHPVTHVSCIRHR